MTRHLLGNQTWRAVRLIGLAMAGALVLSSCGEAGTDSSEDEDNVTEDASGEANGDGEDAADSIESDEPIEEVAGGGVLRVAQQLPIETLDPDRNAVAGYTLVTHQLYDRLASLGPDGTAQPMLAESWEIAEDENGPYIDFSLRTGLQFADGAVFGANTVVANIERSRSLEGSTTIADVEGLEVEEVSESVVRFRNDAGVAQLPLVMSGIVGSMISQDAISQGMDLSTSSMGLGPFVVEALEPERLVLSRNSDYWDAGAILVDGMEILSMATDARVSALRAGDVDLTHVPAELADSFSDDIQIDIGPGQYNVASYKLNTSFPPLDDVRVRRALSVALDREGICNAGFGGSCDPAPQIFSVNSPYYNPDASEEFTTYDPELARDLLEEAGATDVSLSISTFDIQGWFDMAVIAQQQWEEVGLEVEVISAAVAESSRAFREGEIPIRTSGVGPYTDPVDILNLALLDGSPDNVGGLVIDDIEELADSSAAAADPERRREIFQEVSAVAAQELPHIPVLSVNLLWARDEGLTGFTAPGVLGNFDVRGVALGEE